MSTPQAPRIAKWPFLFGDLLLLAAAAYLQYRTPQFNIWVAGISLLAVAVAAWFGTRPYMEEYRANLKLAESETLTDSLEQIGQIETVASQISAATGQWQTVNDHASRSVAAVREVWDKMQSETRDFRAFLERANDMERSHLRLEVDKLKRAEAEWLHILVRILDNTFALYLGAVRSEQAPLIEQITQFQNISRDAARRVGLIPFVPKLGDAFDPKLFETVEGQSHTPPAGALVTEVIATGYTYQGQLLRRPLVIAALPASPAAEPAPIAPDENKAELVESASELESPASEEVATTKIPDSEASVEVEAAAASQHSEAAPASPVEEVSTASTEPPAEDHQETPGSTVTARSSESPPESEGTEKSNQGFLL